ncbi:hypothetical protein [Gardnerella vaginalis]|uniref:hypothetical protein n=1 Tax=Gardnerella vaginalis TaxID=2702 RepID=UPI001785FD8A|nr:hypothetical protein [Gardnerella vaginalis]MBE0296398.1 hypothetical protein [Gardnerella vaginalis]
MLYASEDQAYELSEDCPTGSLVEEIFAILEQENEVFVKACLTVVDDFGLIIISA